MTPKIKYILKGAIIATVIGVWFLGILAPIIGATIAYCRWQQKIKSGESQPESSSKKPVVAHDTEVQYCVALWALSMAAAWADGDVSTEEKQEGKNILKKYLVSLNEEQIKEAHERLENFKIMCPNPKIEDAFVEINKLNVDDYEIFTHVVNTIIRTDNQLSAEEEKFLSAWQQYVNMKNKQIGVQ